MEITKQEIENRLKRIEKKIDMLLQVATIGGYLFDFHEKLKPFGMNGKAPMQNEKDDRVS